MGKDGRQYVRYGFYKVDGAWRHRDPLVKAQQRKELAGVIDRLAKTMMVRTYSTMATRADADFLLWTASESLEDFQALSTQIHSTAMGHYLTMPHSFLAMTRESLYVERHQHPGQEGRRLAIRPRGTKYLFVYPFVKTREWYMLPAEKRQEMMSTHIAYGHKYPGVTINTTYSFGIDDQEFVVSFEAGDPGDFLDLVMDLRETQASKYTLRDTPAFTCVSMSMTEILESLGA